MRAGDRRLTIVRQEPGRADLDHRDRDPRDATRPTLRRLGEAIERGPARVPFPRASLPEKDFRRIPGVDRPGLTPVKESRIGELAANWEIVLGYTPEA